jgi:hypothetical protein
MEQRLKSGGKAGSVTVSTALLNQKLATLRVPRMLSPSEIELLQKSKREIAERYRAAQA